MQSIHQDVRWRLRQLTVFLRRHRKRIYSAATMLFIAWLPFHLFVYQAPASFVAGKVVRIEEGATLSDAAKQLDREMLIRSPFMLKALVTLLGGDGGVIAGDYYFKKKKGVGGVAWMLVRGNYGLEPVRITIPEGASVRDIADIMERSISLFNDERFVRLAENKEGYLFPDTYFFLPNVSERSVVETLSKAFSQQISGIEEEIEAFGRPLDEIVTMASILEREAYTAESRRTIAGILWKRLELGMPLQVDATFDYINGKNSFELTLDDLDIDSPYNTYRNRGLPPGPIANPGLDAIRAAISPIESDYLYFLSDRGGTVYYSRTFEEHREKKARYLN